MYAAGWHTFLITALNLSESSFLNVKLTTRDLQLAQLYMAITVWSITTYRIC